MSSRNEHLPPDLKRIADGVDRVLATDDNLMLMASGGMKVEGFVTNVWLAPAPKDVDRMLAMLDFCRRHYRLRWYVRAWLWLHGWRYELNS